LIHSYDFAPLAAMCVVPPLTFTRTFEIVQR
jgi:hypothetical protein